MSNLDYTILKGDLLIADRDPVTGSPGPFTNTGEAPVFELEPNVEFKDNFSTGKDTPNEQDMHVAVQRALGVSITLKEKTAQNLELALHGTKSAVASGAVASQSFPSGIVAGETRILPGGHIAVSAVVIKDSAGAPAATLTPGTDYTVDTDYGTITFLNSAGFAGFQQPFKASYSYAARNDVTILSKTVTDKVLMLEGLNLVNGKKERILLHRVSLSPAAKVSGKSEDVTMYELKGQALKDPTKQPTDALGQFGVYSQL